MCVYFCACKFAINKIKETARKSTKEVREYHQAAILISPIDITLRNTI